MKNIVITGTSSGIGLELVKLYAKKNCKILSLSRSPSLINNINNVKHIRFDITNQNSIDEIRSIIENEYKVVDILINNAGKLINKAFLDNHKMVNKQINLIQLEHNKFYKPRFILLEILFFFENTK